MNDAVFLEILRKHWGYDSFRGIQLSIIRSIAAGRDTLGLMPTGGGKSITFQVPALAMEGVCLVVTPLIALMKDQVENLYRRGILATAIYAGLSHEEILKRLDNAVYGAYKFLYVSPERLSSPLFLAKLQHMKISFLTIDEAHCISQWGYDFRPSYLRIAEVRQVKPEVAVLALTATATPRVVEDMLQVLSFRCNKGETLAQHVFQMSFDRKNLSYVVRTTEDKEAELLHILRSVPGTAIVYTRSREGTREVAQLLQQQGVLATFYHAGLNDVEKDVRQRAWQQNEVRVMVATNAFGMGIDKPDVRLVVHMDLPDSLEAYFQEAGRAGRDGAKAYSVLLYHKSDSQKLRRRIPETFPAKDDIRRVYEHLAYFLEIPEGEGEGKTREVNVERFCVVFRFYPTLVLSALRLLTQAGYVYYRDEEDTSSRLLFITPRDDLYRLQHLGGMADKVIYALLRHYAGLFADYVFIDESLLATATESSEAEVYETLKLLTHQRILHYIPRKKVPRITYLQRRLPACQLAFPPAIYEDRMENYKERITAILAYAEGTEECRSRLLLAYFGEVAKEDCGVCDVCLSRRRKPRKDLRKHILSLLSERGTMSLEDFPHAGYSTQDFQTTLQALIAEEQIVWEKGKIRLP